MEIVHSTESLDTMAMATATAPLRRPFVPGQDLDRDTLNALRAAGLSQAEVASQLDAMHNLEVHNTNAAAAVAQSSGQWSVGSRPTRNCSLERTIPLWKYWRKMK
jgi:hypothetical protein